MEQKWSISVWLLTVSLDCAALPCLLDSIRVSFGFIAWKDFIITIDILVRIRICSCNSFTVLLLLLNSIIVCPAVDILQCTLLDWYFKLFQVVVCSPSWIFSFVYRLLGLTILLGIILPLKLLLRRSLLVHLRRSLGSLWRLFLSHTPALSRSSFRCGLYGCIHTCLLLPNSLIFALNDFLGQCDLFFKVSTHFIWIISEKTCLLTSVLYFISWLILMILW